MRVLAPFCADTSLSALFQNPAGDVYKLVASKIMRKPVDAISTAERQLAKTVSLGVIYGMGVKELAKRFKISEQRAVQFISDFFGFFPNVKRWTAHVKAKARTDGFVTTIANRRRQVDLLSVDDRAAKSMAERKVVIIIKNTIRYRKLKLAQSL